MKLLVFAAPWAVAKIAWTRFRMRVRDFCRSEETGNRFAK